MTETDYAAKIDALLRKAEATDNPHEAEAFSAAAERLMLKWSVDDAMLEAIRAEHGTKTADPIVAMKVKTHGPKAYSRISAMLATAIAGGMNTVKVIRHGDTGYISAHGTQADLDRWATLYESLAAQANGARLQWARELWRDAKGSDHSAFLMGFATKVRERLTEERKHVVEETTGSELVLVNAKKRVEDAFAAAYPHARSGRKATVRSAAGYSNGQAAGGRASLRGERALAR